MGASFNVNLKSLVKLAAASLYAYTCCPQCGAPLGGGDRCEYCGSPVPKQVMDRLVGLILQATSRRVLNADLGDLGIEIDKLKTSVFREAEGLRRLFDSMIVQGVKGDEIRSYVSIVIREGEIPDKIKQPIPDMTGKLEDPRKILQNFLIFYKARRHKEAMHLYSNLLLSIFSMEIGDEPKYAVGVPLPNGLFDVSRGDVDRDGKLETVLIPSKEIGAVNILGSIVEKIGADVSALLGIDANPRVAQILIVESEPLIYAIWENANLLDMKVKINGKTKYYAGKFMISAKFFGDKPSIVIATNRGILVTDGIREEKLFIGNINAIHALDYDNDGLDELLVISANRSLYLVDYSNDEIQLRRIGDVTGSEMLASMFFVNREVGFILSDDGIYQIDESPVLIYQPGPGEVGLGITKMSIGKRDYLAYVYNKRNEIRLKIFGEKTFKMNGQVLSVTEELHDIPILVVAPEKSSLVLEFEKTKNIPDFPKNSRWFLKAADVDRDGVDELFLGSKRTLLSIDLKFA